MLQVSPSSQNIWLQKPTAHIKQLGVISIERVLWPQEGKWPSQRGRREEQQSLLPQKMSWHWSQSELRGVTTRQSLLHSRMQSFQEKAPTGVSHPQEFSLVHSYFFEWHRNSRTLLTRDPSQGFTSPVFFCSRHHDLRRLPRRPPALQRG